MKKKDSLDVLMEMLEFTKSCNASAARKIRKLAARMERLEAHRLQQTYPVLITTGRTRCSEPNWSNPLSRVVVGPKVPEGCGPFMGTLADPEDRDARLKQSLKNEREWRRSITRELEEAQQEIRIVSSERDTLAAMWESEQTKYKQLMGQYLEHRDSLIEDRIQMERERNEARKERDECRAALLVAEEYIQKRAEGSKLRESQLPPDSHEEQEKP